MASASYLTGRFKYTRPQGMLWADNPGTLENGLYVPQGFEVGSDVSEETDLNLFNQFIILSDDNRGPISFNPTRIETRKRTVNGRMRSYHIADKLSIDVSWEMLPSRSYANIPNFDQETGLSEYKGNRSLEYTTDGGAGGVEILDWYENHQGPFWVYLAYDKYSNFDKEQESSRAYLQKYNQVIEMYFAGFQYSVEKRGGSNFDFWNISVTLEEV